MTSVQTESHSLPVIRGTGLDSAGWTAVVRDAAGLGLATAGTGAEPLDTPAPSASVLVLASVGDDAVPKALAQGYSFGQTAGLDPLWLQRLATEAAAGTHIGWCLSTGDMVRERVTPWLLDHLVATGVLGEQMRGDCDLLLTEAIANASLHGNLRIAAPTDPFDPALARRGVGVFATVDDNSLWWRVWQEGDGSPDAEAKLEALLGGAMPDLENPGGRGLFIVSRMAQAVRFEDAGRCLAMRVSRV